MSDSESNDARSDQGERIEIRSRGRSCPPSGGSADPGLSHPHAPGGGGADPDLSGPPDRGATPSRRRRRRSGSQSFNLSDDEVKRMRRGESDSDYNVLLNKIDILTNVLLQNVILPSPASQITINSSKPLPASNSETYGPTSVAGAGCDPVQGPTSSALEFSLQRPGPAVASGPGEPRRLNLSQVSTSLKDPKVPRADSGHLKLLETLQKFGDPSWKDVRYAEALKIHNAAPGFVDLEVNDELRQFVKGKDFTANSEKITAAICNGLITQRKLLNQNLQEFLNWTSLPGAILTSENIFDKISELFQTSSKFHKVSEEIMQMVCGKRAEYIESRRDRILNELPNKNLREGLRKIPPSSKHLFDETQLRSYIQSTGGMDKWMRPWFQNSKETRKADQKPTNKVSKPGTSRDFSQQSFRRENESSSKKPNNYGARQAEQFRSKRFIRKDARSNKKPADK
ncbi:hypothetical protein O0L34_g5875 [Tuta absoluta]|nr:hypothetical protein O0L34_g5875 [Tuta absoluta]